MTSTTEGLAYRLRDAFVDLDVAPDQAIRRAALVFVGSSVPLLLTILLAGAAAVLLQTGFLLNTHALTPDPGRLDPRRGLRRVFGADNIVEASKAVAKLTVLAWAVWSALSSLLPVLPAALLWPAPTLIDRFGGALVNLVVLVFAAQLGIALLDAGWTRLRFTQRLRMSREDLRQETREADGDPKVKMRLRQIRAVRGRRRMLAAVAKATVVITNPTHYAVALVYERGRAGAPRVVAKGVDDVAARIRAAAERAGVPLVANPALARTLYAMPLDAEVPAEHFKVVAEIIAYVWRLQHLSQRIGTGS